MNNLQKIVTALAAVALLGAAGCATAKAEAESEPAQTPTQSVTPTPTPPKKPTTYKNAKALFDAVMAGEANCKEGWVADTDIDADLYGYTSAGTCGKGGEIFRVYRDEAAAKEDVDRFSANPGWEYPLVYANNWVIILGDTTSIFDEAKSETGGQSWVNPRPASQIKAIQKAEKRGEKDGTAGRKKNTSRYKTAEERTAYADEYDLWYEEPAPKPKPKPAAERVTERQWAKVVRNPDKHAGKKFIIYGEVTQFDTATGEETFRADVAHRDTTSYGYFDGDNAILIEGAGDVDDLVEDDVFRASVTVVGSSSYETTLGGEITVPQLIVNSVTVIGHN